MYSHTKDHVPFDVPTKLVEEGFTITTRWQQIFTGYFPDRIYGFVTVGGRDRGELLVENGLGCIHGQTVWGLTQPVRERLAKLEEKAKAEGRGAWGVGNQLKRKIAKGAHGRVNYLPYGYCVGTLFLQSSPRCLMLFPTCQLKLNLF